MNSPEASSNKIMKAISIHPEAQAEFEQALVYYATHQRTPTAARDFRREIEAAIVAIHAHPLRFRLVAPGLPLRKFGPTAKFRYSVFYRVDEAKLTVLAVTHPSRRPDYWERRV